MTQVVQTCPFCPKLILETKIPRAACEDHMQKFMVIKRDKMKPVSFQKAYYRQKRRPARIATKPAVDPAPHKCRYCGTEFMRSGLEQFCPGSRCGEKWAEENPRSTDYSLIKQEELERMYYKDNLSLKAIAKWYQDNKNLRITHDTVRNIMIKFGITWEKKQQLLTGAKKG